MKVPIVETVGNLLAAGLEFANSKDKRRRQAIVRSAKKVVEHLRDFEVPKDARHYLDQLEIRLGRIT